ncbi:hypothetical protein FALBO_5840 [Fusarium albosuccineum]|uniref:Uncharacterized protein n=1 Tax=Fusarium albosuccineum TaxID=1237068 RepID=A0A8H4LE29_9HYPO|nr:hypothetical protein FALBO_5840 [Fusarium albosuccineum]
MAPRRPPKAPDDPKARRAPKATSKKTLGGVLKADSDGNGDVGQKIRRNGKTIRRKIYEFGRSCDIFSFVCYYHKIHGLMDGSTNLPEGEDAPDLNAAYREILARQRVSSDGRLVELDERQRVKYLKGLPSGPDKPVVRRDPPRRRTRSDAASAAVDSRRFPTLPQITVANSDEANVRNVPPSIWDVPDDLASVDAEQASDQGRAESAGVNYAHGRRSSRPIPISLPSVMGGNVQGGQNAVEEDSAECSLENRPYALTEQGGFFGSADCTVPMLEGPWPDDNYGNMEGFDFGELNVTMGIDEVHGNDGGMHRSHIPQARQAVVAGSSAADQTNFQPTAFGGITPDGGGLEGTTGSSVGTWANMATCVSDAPAQTPKPVQGGPKNTPISAGSSGASVQPGPQGSSPAGPKRPCKMTMEQVLTFEMKALTLLGWNPWARTESPIGI